MTTASENATPVQKPSKCHLLHAADEVMAIVHFGLNTYADKEWGYGDTPPSAFNPARLDTDQWVDAMAAAGIRRVVMVAKHHDGFNLWPSPLNKDYSVSASPWKDGTGDVVKALRESCLKKGVHFGVYVSPWDRHQASYGTDDYPAYFHAQWAELLRDYGPVSEIWLDGANGGDGYYGGACETRKLKVRAWDYYDIPRLLDSLVAAYPDAIAFGGGGRNSAAWVGNEQGTAPNAVWYESKGFWHTPECDTPLRAHGWFWHRREHPKSLAHLVDVYFDSVGRGCVLNLGIAPNTDGLVGDDDVARLKEFGDYIRAFNANDFADGVEASPDGRSFIVTRRDGAKVNAIDVCEDLADGQFIAGWKLEAEENGGWRELADGVTVGFRRIERFAETNAKRFRFTVTATRGNAKIKSIALRYAPAVPREKDDNVGVTFFMNYDREYFRASQCAENEVVVDFLNPTKTSGFVFKPRQSPDGHPDRYEVRTSTDGTSWGDPIAEGEFSNVRASKEWVAVYYDKPVKGRYFKFTATRALEGAPKWTKGDIEFF